MTNNFELEGEVTEVVPKTTRNGRRFNLVKIETDHGDTIPLSIWGRPPAIGERVHVEGRLTGYGDFANPKVTSMEVIRELAGASVTGEPASGTWEPRQSNDAQTGHEEDDGWADVDLPF